MGILNNRTMRALAKVTLLATLLTACSGNESTTTTTNVVPPTPTEASCILAQGTFGPTLTEVGRLTTMGASAWFNDQFSKPQRLHFTYMNAAQAALPAGQTISEDQFFESFWQQAVNGDDQLRQRVAFALSEIFVVSFQNGTLANNPRGVAHYYDMLGAYAFGNFRVLLEQVTLHPMMGNYLSSLRNQKTIGARLPDENYAREVMQLFTIGLKELNQDGTEASPPKATYTSDDIKGLAKVFTGWSWYGTDKTDTRFFGGTPDPNRDWLPMQNYPKFHETLPKAFLGVTIPANTSGEESLKFALDTLFNHPNVGPFIGRKLIQRLVTSNPSHAYIGRVAKVFADNGQGVRGDMKAVIKAVLLDPEAMTFSSADSAGKLREPVIRLANWMRAFNATSSSGHFLVGNIDDPLHQLGQTPMRSPTVFNFFKPEYIPPNSAIAAANLVAPEMQITEETSVVGYLNYMRNAIPNGTGSSNDIKANYTAELALAATPELLVDRINLLLLQNNMSAGLRSQILAAINSTPGNTAQNKVYLAIFLTMASPEYLVQK
ncbi:MAG: DUF1800 domain-containing protein [Gallionella sp.]|nr:DUF1800 domain-containing protein [Gallionella sp.]